eukprot:s1821_g9.t1
MSHPYSTSQKLAHQQKEYPAASSPAVPASMAQFRTITTSCFSSAMSAMVSQTRGGVRTGDYHMIHMASWHHPKDYILNIEGKLMSSKC